MTFLIACGGGGGGAAMTGTPTTMPPGTRDPVVPPGTGDPATPPATVTPEDLPNYAIMNLPAARTRIVGSMPASATEPQIITAIQTRATAADTLRVGDVILAGEAGLRTDIKPTCSGKSCAADVPSVGRLAFTLSDIKDLSLVDDAPLIGFNSETQAVLIDNGITTAQSRTAARQDDGTQLTFQTYGGWTDGSVFGAVFLNITEGANTTSRFTSFSFGDSTGSNPTGTGRAMWTGSAVGIDTDNNQPFQGDVTVDIDDLSNPDVDVSITDGRRTNRDTAVPFIFTWEDMTLTDGIFQSTLGDGDIWGSFYGSNHEEVGGVFDDDSTVGAFGATRQGP